MEQAGSFGNCSVTILGTSDLHGHILPIHYANNSSNEVGLAKIATIIEQERENSTAVIVIDNGDLIQGTPLAYHHARLDNASTDPMVLCLNALQFDAAVIGNHEFNYGFDVLHKAIKESQFPWLCATIVDEKSGEPYFGRPYLVKELPEGVRVGILGLTTPYIPNWENPNHIVGMQFIDAVEAANKWVKLLREEEKVDVLAVSYHGGFERDLITGEATEPLTGENQGYQLCQEVPGIDVLMTGHQHHQIAGLEINGVLIMQPGSQGTFLGKVEIELEQTEQGWIIVTKKSELVPVTGVPANAAILKLVAPYEGKNQEWLDQPIGKLSGDMLVKDPMQTRLKDNALIEFINRVQMELSGADISNTALFDNISPGFPANITMRDIVSNYVFPNTLKVIRISGQDIKNALEQTANYFKLSESGSIEVNPQFMEPKPQHYNYDMWEGITYRLNISRVVGERVVQLDYKGSPMDMNAQYDVVMNNYRAGGGGNYAMFQGKPAVKDIPTDVPELIASYIMERGTIEATLNHNWEVITD